MHMSHRWSPSRARGPGRSPFISSAINPTKPTAHNSGTNLEGDGDSVEWPTGTGLEPLNVQRQSLLKQLLGGRRCCNGMDLEAMVIVPGYLGEIELDQLDASGLAGFEKLAQVACGRGDDVDGAIDGSHGRRRQKY